MSRREEESDMRRTALATIVLISAACWHAAPSRHPHGDGEDADARARTATAEDWAGTTPARAEELFVGRFAGVRVVTAPGGISVRIRGTSTINGDGAPLYVVDGMAIEAPNGLLTMNPSDIAKIEVLKDIGATSYYGVRGANGVVLITTKRGR